MTAEQLAQIAGVILSLAFAYIPGIKERYDLLEATQKASVMAGLLILVALGAFAVSCGGLYNVGITCDKAGAVGLIQVLIAALVANQGTYVLLVKPYQK